MMNLLNIVAYSVYLLVSIYVTVWVGHQLYKHGEIFLKEIFKHNVTMVPAINKLLLIGYYFINLGYVLVLFVHSAKLESLSNMIELLSSKLGIVIISLGIIHALNLLTFFIIYRRSGQSDSNI